MDPSSIVTMSNSPPVESKTMKSTLGKIFKPWKWNRKKKQSEKIEKRVTTLEKKISQRVSKEELIRRGVFREVEIPSECKNVSKNNSQADDSTYFNATVDLSLTAQNVPIELEAELQPPSTNQSFQNFSNGSGCNVILTSSHSTPLVSDIISTSYFIPNEQPVSISHFTMPQQNWHITELQDGQDGYEEVKVHEPDLSKQPLRSAMKGAKSKELQKQMVGSRNEGSNSRDSSPSFQFNKVNAKSSPSATPRIPPKVAPKPILPLRFIDASRIDLNKENGVVRILPKVPDDFTFTPEEMEARLRRSDSLARLISQRPPRGELVERNIIPEASEQDRLEARIVIETKLDRRLSLRPTAEDLENKHILLKQTPEELERELEERKRTLLRKLSFRPTIDELKERKIIKFSDYVEVTEAEPYDRKADKPWTRLTPRDKAAIRKELNEFKRTEMTVHEESQHLTRYHRP